MSGADLVTRPDRARDIAFVAESLAAWQQNGTYVLDGIDLAATDLASRRAVVERIERLSRVWARLGRQRHWAYSYPLHAQLLDVLKRERAELAALAHQEAAE